MDHQAATWLPSLPATNPFLHLHLISADSLQWIGFVGKSTGFSWDLPTQIARCPAIFPYLKAIPCKDSVECNIIEQSGWIDLESMKDMPTMPSCFLSPSSKVQEAALALSRELSLSFPFAPATLIPLCFKVAAKEEPRTQKGNGGVKIRGRFTGN